MSYCQEDIRSHVTRYFTHTPNSCPPSSAPTRTSSVMDTGSFSTPEKEAHRPNSVPSTAGNQKPANCPPYAPSHVPQCMIGILYRPEDGAPPSSFARTQYPVLSPWRAGYDLPAVCRTRHRSTGLYTRCSAPTGSSCSLLGGLSAARCRILYLHLHIQPPHLDVYGMTSSGCCRWIFFPNLSQTE